MARLDSWCLTKAAFALLFDFLLLFLVKGLYTGTIAVFAFYGISVNLTDVVMYSRSALNKFDSLDDKW